MANSIFDDSGTETTRPTEDKPSRFTSTTSIFIVQLSSKTFQMIREINKTIEDNELFGNYLLRTTIMVQIGEY